MLLESQREDQLYNTVVLRTTGEGAEDPAEFEELMSGLHRDLAPVGALEETLVEKIAVCLWRQKRALKWEAGLVRRELVGPGRELEDLLQSRLGTNPNRAPIHDHLSLPLRP